MQEPGQKLSSVMSQVAGYIAIRAVGVGFRYGLFARLADHREGMRSATLAAETNLNPSYVDVRGVALPARLDYSRRPAPHIGLMKPRRGFFWIAIPTCISEDS